MKRYVLKMTFVAFVVYVLIGLLINLIFKGTSEFSEQFLKILFLSIFSGVIFVALYFGFLWYSLRATIGYLDSDSFDEPTYGHKLAEEVETRITDFNSFKDIFSLNYSHVKYSKERWAIKFFKASSFIRWEVCRIAYLDPKTGNVKIILLPFSGYSRGADRLLNDEMKRVKELLTR